MHDELLSVGYSYNTMSGGLVPDSKDQLKKDVGKSPDLADAAVYAAITDQNIRDAIQQETVFPSGDDGRRRRRLPHEMGRLFWIPTHTRLATRVSRSSTRRRGHLLDEGANWVSYADDKGLTLAFIHEVVRGLSGHGTRPPLHKRGDS